MLPLRDDAIVALLMEQVAVIFRAHLVELPYARARAEHAVVKPVTLLGRKTELLRDGFRFLQRQRPFLFQNRHESRRVQLQVSSEGAQGITLVDPLSSAEL